MLIAQLEALLRANRCAVSGIEVVFDAEGKGYVIDVNTCNTSTLATPRRMMLFCCRAESVSLLVSRLVVRRLQCEGGRGGGRGAAGLQDHRALPTDGAARRAGRQRLA